MRKVAQLLCQPLKLFGTVKKYLFNRLVKAISLIKFPDWIFFAGKSAAWKEHKGTKLIPINFCDFERYRDMRDAEKPLLSTPYALFLDIYLPFQSDLKIVGWETISPQPYLESLNRFFTFVENHFDVQIVIAGHPKSSYPKETFQGRLIIKDKMPQLIRHSSFVLSHHSTSISYAVMDFKPIIFFYTEEMARVYKNTVVSYINDFAQYLHCPSYNIDREPVDLISIPKVNEKAYKSYIYDFLTSRECEEKNNTEIVMKEIFGVPQDGRTPAFPKDGRNAE